MPGRRRTIGLLADHMNPAGTAYESHLRDAIDARCRQCGYDLLVVFGRAFEDPVPSSAAHNAVFHLIGPDVVDGLLLVASCLSVYCGLEGIRRLARRYPMPLCSIGLSLPGVPSVMADNRPGMQAVVEHLITVHGCRRIAFLAGTPENPEAQIRLAVYREVLEKHGLPIDPDLILGGLFSKGFAQKAVAELLDRGASVDAVVAANDAMAAGAIEVLRGSGRRIPRDVLVTGFDDMPLARLGNPPLTTVRQPLLAMANTAVDALLAQIEGRPVPLCAELPTEMIVRRSCGCQQRSPALRKADPAKAITAITVGKKPAEYVRAREESLKRSVGGCLEAGFPEARRKADRLVAVLILDLEGDTGAFLRVVEDLAAEVADNDEGGRALQIALAALREELSGIANPELEDIWYEASLLVALANGSGRALYRLATDEANFYLMRSAELTNLAADVPALEKALLKFLPEVGVRTGFLSRYTDPDREQLEAFVCLFQGQQRPPATNRFLARQLVPPGVYPKDQRHTWLVYPLVCEVQQLGVAVFEYEGGNAGYDAVLTQTSIALRNIGFHDEIVQKTMLHERSVQERLATTKRLDALGTLAGCVAHDLNNSLSPMLALSDVLLAELVQLPLPKERLEDLRADTETIKIASLQASQTIKDLLTLGRQGRLAKSSVDVNQVVQECLEPRLLRSIREAHPGIAFGVELCPVPVMILGSQPQLTRAVANLVNNSVDAIHGHGQVVIRTSRTRFTEPAFGYERIEPGEYAIVTVTDNGSGIAAQELSRIFEPFFSKKRTAERSGTGLGLAIVHGVTKEHGGYVDVVSTVGKGSTFTLYFPVTEEPVRRCAPLPSVRPGTGRVLVVDDDPLLLRTCGRILRRLGYHVDTTDSGRRACELFLRAENTGTSPYDVVVMDMMLNEDWDGLQVLEQIHRVFPNQKAIVASGHAPTERAQMALQRGLHWLAKPYSADSLARSVQEVLAAR